MIKTLTDYRLQESNKTEFLAKPMKQFEMLFVNMWNVHMLKANRKIRYSHSVEVLVHNHHQRLIQGQMKKNLGKFHDGPLKFL